MNRSELRQMVQRYAREHMIATGIAAALAIALLLTIASMWFYNQSDVARLDVSRPGYESVRQAVVKGNDETKFDTTGVLDSRALDDFQKLFDERRKPLEGYGRFDGVVLNDDQLKLAAPAPPAENTPAH